MARLAIFVDGGYVAKLAENHFRLWVDYGRLSSKITEIIRAGTDEKLDLMRTYYYDCLPYQGDPPTEDEARRFSRKRGLFTALEHLPKYTVRQGRLMKRGEDSDGRPIFQQKKVDLMIGLDIALLAAKNRITHAAVLSGDSDLLPAVEAAKQEGVNVWLVHGPSSTYANELLLAVDDRVALEDFINEVVQRR